MRWDQNIKRAAWLTPGSQRLLVAIPLLLAPALAWAWNPVVVQNDALVRQPGTQPNQQVSLQPPTQCVSCHADYDPFVEPGFAWRGSMMAQSARDPLFWAALTVAAQDSIYAFGRPNAADTCERCHLPAGWLAGRSDPTNASMMFDHDFEGVTCDACHRLYDPFFTDTYSGAREGNDWLSYWDETNASGVPSQAAADMTLMLDAEQANALLLFNGQPLYDATMHFANGTYTENANGEYYATQSSAKRGPFSDDSANHGTDYSRYHKSKFFCSTCHDVSNTPVANAAFIDTPPNDGVTVLPSEAQPAHSYYALERTFSEFMLSDFGLPGGAFGIGPFAPGVFTTSRPGNVIATCQDCHLPDRSGKGCDQGGAKIRPTDSMEHPQSGQPVHEMTGGNALIPWILASTVPTSPNYDPTNESLLGQGTAILTLDMTAGMPLQPIALLAGHNRALDELARAAAIQLLTYNPATGATQFRIQNNTGHKLTTGYPEGRRMFANLKLYQAGNLIYEVNPYDPAIATLKGLDPTYSPNSPPLAPTELHDDALVYEAHSASTYTAQLPNFHFVLATSMHKDNRIPPKGFRINEASTRQAEPAWSGAPAPAYFSASEYAGGYDDVTLALPPGGDKLVVALYYQTTSREYAEFLQNEIKGTATTLTSPTPSGEPNAYVAQTDPFFASLKAWGDTIWQLWLHNKDVPGAAPVLMTQSAFVTNTCQAQPDGTACDDGNLCTSGDTCMAGICQGGATINCDDQNVCTDDTCDAQVGCVHSFNNAPCEEGNLCKGPDACAYGYCVAGATIFCYDNDPCTDDTCDPQNGCTYPPISGPGCGGGGGSGGAGTTSSSTGVGGSGAQGGMAGMGGGSMTGGSDPTTSGGTTPPPGDDGGCGCVAAGSDPASGKLSALAMLGLLALLGRRRRDASS